MKKYFKFILLLGISLIFFTGCVSDLVVPENDLNSADTENGSSSPTQEDGVVPEKGTLKIYLTDAPGDYLEVNIIISKIEGHIAGDGEEGEDKGSWEVLKEWPDGLPVDLLTLENVSLLLGSSELAPNKYTQLRIFLKEEATLVLEGEEGEDSKVIKTLEIPSSANAGIKLNRPFEIVEGMITELTIDFDAEKSVIKTGNGKYKMKPVISVSSETYSTGELPEGVGSVSGSVSYYESDEGVLVLAGIGGANIELTGGAYIFGNTTITSTVSPIGEFSLENVPTGSYILNVYAEGYNDYSESIKVIAMTKTEVDIVLLSGGISGIVKEFESESTFIAGATVTVTLSGGDIFNSSTSTNESGEFVIEQLPVGSYDLIISADDYDDSSIFAVAVTEGVINNLGEIELTKSTPSL